uniref:Uncharacterized protein n=1 Tax=Cacopsylla melanoneura TaxID=428564 RepID=A0A8D8Q0K0_9HEMI
MYISVIHLEIYTSKMYISLFTWISGVCTSKMYISLMYVGTYWKSRLLTVLRCRYILKILSSNSFQMYLHLFSKIFLLLRYKVHCYLEQKVPTNKYRYDD